MSDFNTWQGYALIASRPVLSVVVAVQLWWFWAVYINPVFWSINGLVGTQLGDVQETMTLQDGGTTQVRLD